MTTFPTPQPLRAIVDIEMGDIRVLAEDVTETVVDVSPTDASSDKDRRAAEQTRVTCAGGRLDVVGPKRSALIGPTRKSGSVQVTVTLPARSSLEARTGLGRIGADGELADVLAKTSMGDVAVDTASNADLKSGMGLVTAGHLSGDLRCTTGSGEVRIDSVAGSALVKNSNGHTWIGDCGAGVRVKAANGDVTVGRARGDVMATSANGSLSVASAEQGSVMLHTSLGSIVLGIREGTAARLELRTGFGSVRNELDSASAPSAGDRTLEVDAQTSAGDIKVVRAFVDDRDA